MTMGANLPLTDFERALRRLEGLTRGEIAELVTAQIVDEDAEDFAVVTEGLIKPRDAPASLRESPGGGAWVSSTDTDVVGAWLQISRDGPRGARGGEEPTVSRRPFCDALAPIAHMRLRTFTNVPGLPGAPELPSMPVIRIPGE